MNLNLSRLVALVTGSSRGIGFEIASMISEEGGNVIINGRHQEPVIRAASFCGASTVIGDVSSRFGARAVVDQAAAIHGQLDIVVCNVGSGASVSPGLEDEQEWLKMLQLNLLATTNVVEAARPYLRDRGGVILCISSICGSAALGAPIAYSAAKAALNSFVRGSARYLASENIRINALVPGNILFDGSTWDRKLSYDPDEVATMLAKDVALGRFGTPREVAAMATFLCSPLASFSTGSLYVLDGGQLRS